MSEAPTRSGARSAQAKTVSHFMKATVAIEFLRAQHGEANARKIALKELRKARRARSRRRFDFWSEVATQIEHGCCGRPELVESDLKRRWGSHRR
jgi:hypothetical protein